MEQKTNKKVALIITILFIAVLVIGATYAYFVAQTGEGKSTDIEISANTVDTFSFAVGDPLKFTADQFTFTEGGTNASASTHAKAVLTANNKTNTVTEHYYLYLKISNNTFEYSQDSSKPELLLQITDKSGNAITSLTGLEYKTVTNGAGTSISGFDVTTKSGLITILNNREITTTSILEEQWNVTLTFVNYEFNQASNGGKSFSAKLMIQKEEYELTLADVCAGKTLSNCVISQYTGTQGENGIYYHDSSLTNGAGDNSYRYAGANPNNFVCFGSDANPCPTDNLYRIIGVFGDSYHGVTGKQLVKLIKYDYMTTDELGTDGDYSTTYKEWGMDSTYKGTYGDGERIGVYYWNNDTQTNTWSESLLNKTNLNTNFINYLGSTWAKKIATVTWKVGGNTYANIYSKIPSVAYTNEITNPDATNSTDNATTYSAKIGLMYVSDYGFAASPSAWTLTMGSYDNTTATSTNWMYMGLYEWTISRYSDDSNNAFGLISDGQIHGSNGVNDSYGARASFNLESSTTYVSGSGSMSDPVRIN